MASAAVGTQDQIILCGCVGGRPLCEWGVICVGGSGCSLHVLHPLDALVAASSLFASYWVPAAAPPTPALSCDSQNCVQELPDVL